MINLEPLFGPKGAKDCHMVEFRIFPSTGSERWMLEVGQKKPWHLKTWPRANIRARLIYQFAWFLGAIGLHLPSRIEGFSVAPDSTYAKLKTEFDHVGVFLGTPGPNRKFVVYAERSGNSVFLKIPLGAISAKLVSNETATLKLLSSDPALCSLIPAISEIEGHLAVENIETKGVEYKKLIPAEVERIHDLLERRSFRTKSISELRCDWEAARPDGDLIGHDIETCKQLEAALNAANAFLNKLPPDSEIPCYMAHGDFTRWNVLRTASGKARIIDWELYGLKPRHFDFIHYFLSDDLLVARHPAARILENLRTLKPQNTDSVTWKRELGMYTACQAIYYSEIYYRQADIHDQALWQLRVWDDLLVLLTRDFL